MADQSSSTPLTSICHCGAITVTVPTRPNFVNECQCTICRRYAAAWAYYTPAEVKIDIREGGAVKKYIWGDKDISFNFCDYCGCVCYWSLVRESTSSKMGVNTRNMDPDQLRRVSRKISFDILTEPLRDKSTAHPEDKATYD